MGGVRVREGQLILPRTVIVITGTSKFVLGLHKDKLDKVLDKYRGLYPNALWITGACVGVDEWAAIHLHLYGEVVYTVVPADRDHVHKKWRRYCSLFETMNDKNMLANDGVTLLSRTKGNTRSNRYMARNQRMVDIAKPAKRKLCLAFPDEPETNRSGTWATVRRARAAKLKVVVTVL